jgi:hypothetical protein
MAEMRFPKAMLAATAWVLVPQSVVLQSAASQSVPSQPAVPPSAAPGSLAGEPPVAEPALIPNPQLPSPRSESDPDGQARADYLAWLARSADARAKVLAFNQYLRMEGLNDVVPNWELLRTASMWRDCNGPRFEVAPFAEWQHIAKSLHYIHDHVVPVIGPVQAVSGYRDDALNKCAKGAPESAHRHFYAIDLVPIRPLSRAGLIRSMCAIHQADGERYDVGLGFYSGVRFHIDSKGYRRWGPDGSSATSPCVTEV